MTFDKRFGKLRVIKKIGSKTLCVCDCGKETLVWNGNLKKGLTKSCGCGLYRAKNMSNTRFYRIWHGMNNRCKYDYKGSNFRNYNDRGISVCKRWNKFINFYEDMYRDYVNFSKKYGEENTTIERVDVDGNYCKENCKWLERSKQNFNKRNNHNLTYKGETKTIREWATEKNILWETIYARLKRGWSIEDSLSSNKRKNQYA